VIYSQGVGFVIVFLRYSFSYRENFRRAATSSTWNDDSLFD
jgi:hypothetical protein